jgi:hypothetical protein
MSNSEITNYNTSTNNDTVQEDCIKTPLAQRIELYNLNRLDGLYNTYINASTIEEELNPYGPYTDYIRYFERLNDTGCLKHPEVEHHQDHVGFKYSRVLISRGYNYRPIEYGVQIHRVRYEGDEHRRPFSPYIPCREVIPCPRPEYYRWIIDPLHDRNPTTKHYSHLRRLKRDPKYVPRTEANDTGILLKTSLVDQRERYWNDTKWITDNSPGKELLIVDSNFKFLLASGTDRLFDLYYRSQQYLPIVQGEVNLPAYRHKWWNTLRPPRVAELIPRTVFDPASQRGIALPTSWTDLRVIRRDITGQEVINPDTDEPYEDVPVFVPPPLDPDYDFELGICTFGLTSEQYNENSKREDYINCFFTRF